VNLGSGFIAGTPVHTPDGVVAIESLRAGDLVLARPPGGGPAVARAVTRTVVHPDLEVLYVGYGSGDRSDALTVGFHHPFWVEPKGWRFAVRLQPQPGVTRPLLLADGGVAPVEGIAPIYTTDQPGVVWVAFGGDRNGAGTLWNYLEGRLVAEGVAYDRDAWDRGRPGRQEGEDILFKATVYDIEVEEGHSYFVGKLGACVADASPAGGDRALRELRTRAEAGEAAAMYEYGLRHVQGEGMPQDGHAGYDWLLKAAERGHAQAQFLVGAMSTDPVTAARYRRIAAEQGHVGAQFDLGVCYETGQGVEADVAAAMHWYGRAMAQGNMAAHYNFGKLWSFGGDGVVDADTHADWFRARADEGDAVAQWVAGLCHASGGAGAAQDAEEAVRYFQLGAAQGFGPAVCSLASRYEDGVGVPQDAERALGLYHRAAMQNVPAAMYRLGCLARDGGVVPQDSAQAMTWLKKAADAGWGEARVALRKMPEGDFSKARQLLAMAERASEGAAPPAKLLWEFGKRVDEPDDVEALPLAFALFLQAAQQEHTEAQLQVAVRYLRGLGVGQDSAEAARWYQRAADHGSAPAQFALAQLHDSGNGVAQDADRARLLYGLAAQQGHREAQVKLGLRTTVQPTLADLGIEAAAPSQQKRPWWKKW
jgi:TPR repeat protein